MSDYAPASGRPMPAPSPFDVLAEELGAVAGRIERDLTLRVEKLLADVARERAEQALRIERLAQDLQARIAAVPSPGVGIDDVVRLVRDEVARAVAALPPAAAGKDADPDFIRACVAEAVSKLPPPADGRDADPQVMKQMIDEAIAALPPAPAGKDADPDFIRACVADAVSKLPPPADGRDADPQVMKQMIDEAVAALPPAPAGPPGRDGAPGMLPAVKEYEDRVHYAGACVTHEGATWQAVRDTGHAPPHGDWHLIAAAGRNGSDGRSFRIRGTWIEGGYDALDIVTLNGAAFVARRDNPGPCPGEGWQMIAQQGRRGPPGEAGRSGKGDRGDPGQPVVSITANEDGLLVLTNGDGSTVTADLYPLLTRVRQR